MPSDEHQQAWSRTASDLTVTCPHCHAARTVSLWTLGGTDKRGDFSGRRPAEYIRIMLSCGCEAGCVGTKPIGPVPPAAEAAE